MSRNTLRRLFGHSSLWLLLSWSACYRPDVSDCIRCTTSCPAGRACVAGWCTPNAGLCSATELDGASAFAEPVLAAHDASEPSAAADAATLAASFCSAGRCCIDEESCFALEPGAELALWLDWTSVTAEQGQLVGWRDRSEHGYVASSASPKARPQVQAIGAGDANILSFTTADALSVAETDGDALDQLLSADFYALVAFAPACPLSISCLLSKHAQSEGLALGLGQAGRLLSFLQCEKPADCKGPEDAAVTPLGCGKSFLLSARYERRAANELTTELRLDGRVVERRDYRLNSLLTNSGPLGIGGGFSPQWRAIGQFGLVALIRGTLSAPEACAIERAAAQALVRAGLRADAALDCVPVAQPDENSAALPRTNPLASSSQRWHFGQ